MNETFEGHRRELLDALRSFVAAARQIVGVRRIALLGSIVTIKPNPKDIDVLVAVADDADLTALATCARRLQGQAQSFNRGADVFLADERGTSSDGRATGETVGLACGGRVTPFIAVGGHISTTISMPLR